MKSGDPIIIYDENDEAGIVSAIRRNSNFNSEKKSSRSRSVKKTQSDPQPLAPIPEAKALIAITKQGNTVVSTTTIRKSASSPSLFHTKLR